MFSTKIRTTIAVLAATFAVGGAAVPAAQATKNDGRYQRSSEALRKAQSCRELKGAVLGAIEQAVQIDGNPDGKNQSDKDAAESDHGANLFLAEAKKEGCSWAQ